MLTAFRSHSFMNNYQQQQQQEEAKKTATSNNNNGNNLQHTVIKSRWKLAHVLGKGAFGEVYYGKDLLDNNRPIAIKVESPFVKKPVLRLEISILQKLQHSHHIARFIACGRFVSPRDAASNQMSKSNQNLHTNTTNGHAASQSQTSPDAAAPPIYSYLVMELLGSNISDLRKKCPNGTFSQSTTALLAKQMLFAIRDVHSIGILHRDIKPGNFCVALDGSDHVDAYGRATCFLIDFGLARRYLSSSGRVRDARSKVGFRGTARYASINAHCGKELSRVDDLWSLFYIIVEFLTGSLPWKGKERDKIGKLKVAHTNHDLVRGLHVSVRHIFDYLMTLSYDAEPDYLRIADYLDQLFLGANVPLDIPYDWVLPRKQADVVPTVSTEMSFGNLSPAGSGATNNDSDHNSIHHKLQQATKNPGVYGQDAHHTIDLQHQPSSTSHMMRQHVISNQHDIHQVSLPNNDMQYQSPTTMMLPDDAMKRRDTLGSLDIALSGDDLASPTQLTPITAIGAGHLSTSTITQHAANTIPSSSSTNPIMASSSSKQPAPTPTPKRSGSKEWLLNGIRYMAAMSSGEKPVVGRASYPSDDTCQVTTHHHNDPHRHGITPDTISSLPYQLQHQQSIMSSNITTPSDSIPDDLAKKARADWITNGIRSLSIGFPSQKEKQNALCTPRPPESSPPDHSRIQSIRSKRFTTPLLKIPQLQS